MRPHSGAGQVLPLQQAGPGGGTSNTASRTLQWRRWQRLLRSRWSGTATGHKACGGQWRLRSIVAVAADPCPTEAFFQPSSSTTAVYLLEDAGVSALIFWGQHLLFVTTRPTCWAAPASLQVARVNRRMAMRRTHVAPAAMHPQRQTCKPLAWVTHSGPGGQLGCPPCDSVTRWLTHSPMSSVALAPACLTARAQVWCAPWSTARSCRRGRWTSHDCAVQRYRPSWWRAARCAAGGASDLSDQRAPCPGAGVCSQRCLEEHPCIWVLLVCE
jgi:hypothetical protein